MEDNDYIEWLILRHLNQEASPVEEAGLEQWLQADPGNRRQYEALEKIWQAAGPALQQQVFDKEAAWKRIQPGLKYPLSIVPSGDPGGPGRVSMRKGLAIAASFILVLSVAGWWYTGRHRSSTSLVVTSQDAVRKVFLPDSSVVYLRRGAVLKYAETPVGGERAVELTGEAYFEAASDPAHPFRVRTAGAIIEDMGTSFLVAGNGTGVEVAVTKGRVKFTDRERSGENIVLDAGDQAILAGNAFRRDRITDPNFMSWQTGVLAFSHTSFDQVMQDIHDLYRIPVSLAPNLQSEAGRINVTARFDHQPLKEVLEEIKLITGLAIRAKNDTLLFYRK